MNDQARSVKGQASGSPPREGQTTCEGTVLGSRDEDLRSHKYIKTFVPTGSSGQHLSRSAATAKLSTVTVAPPPRPADGERRQSATTQDSRGRKTQEGSRLRRTQPAPRLTSPAGTATPGAKECKFCRFRKMLKNASFLAIVDVHTAENEPLKILGG